MIAFGVMLALTTGLLVGVLAYSRAVTALHSEAQAKLDLLARDLADGVRGELASAQQLINNWSSLEVMRSILYSDVDKELAQFLHRSLEARSSFRAVSVVDSEGTLIASAGGVLPDSDLRVDTADLPIWHQGAHPQVALRGPIAHPDRTRERIGTLVVLVDLTKAFNTDAAAGAAARGVEAVLLSESGEILASVGDGAAEKRSIGDRSAEKRPAELLVATRSLSLATAGGSLMMTLRASQPSVLALSRISELRATMLSVGLLALMASAALGALIAWRIGRPVRALTASITKIGASGRLDPDIEVPDATGDIGVLSRSFKGMVEALSEAQLQNEDRERLAVLGELSASVAHEIRTPMAVLKMSAQMLDDVDTDPADRERLIGMISTEVERIDGLINNLLGVSRPRPLVMTSLDLARVADRAIALVRPACRQVGVEITVSGDDANYPARANGDALHQVFVNLLRNALQADSAGGKIRVRFARDGARVRIAIEDDGCGFAPEVIESAMLPFVTTKPDGSGLGLPICRRVIEEHGGELTISNGSEGGAVVEVLLPLEGGSA